MSKSNSIASELKRLDTTNAIKRAEEEIRNGVDQVKEMGATVDKNLRTQTARVKAKTDRFSKDVSKKTRALEKDLTRTVRNKPWLAVGGAFALGVVIGALSRGR